MKQKAGPLTGSLLAGQGFEPAVMSPTSYQATHPRASVHVRRRFYPMVQSV